MLGYSLFIAGLCFLLVHEMDAVRLKEWRLMPILSRLGDESGYLAFTALHIPLYALFFWGLFGGGLINRGLVIALDVFFVVHLALHVALRNRPGNEFRSAFSWALFVGAGICGAVDLLLRL